MPSKQCLLGLLIRTSGFYFIFLFLEEGHASTAGFLYEVPKKKDVKQVVRPKDLRTQRDKGKGLDCGRSCIGGTAFAVLHSLFKHFSSFFTRFPFRYATTAFLV